jgi:hypothetical protein
MHKTKESYLEAGNTILKFCKAMAIQVLLYGSEMWTLTMQ